MLSFSQGRWWRAEVVALESNDDVRLHYLGRDPQGDATVPRHELQAYLGDSIQPTVAASLLRFSKSPPAATDRRHAVLELESFSSMCHITLHWEKFTPDVRAQIEDELNKNLESAAPLENVGAGWFLNISGMIFGTLVMIVLTLVALVVMFRR